MDTFTMSEQISNQNTTSPMDTSTSTATSSNAIHPRQWIPENFVLIWVDDSIDQSTQDCQNTLAQLRSIVNNVNIFTQRDECIDFLAEVDDIKAFLILGGTLGLQIVPLIHDIPQLDNIYIFCDNKSHHEQWAKEWAKIKGVHTEIKPICEALQLTVKQCNQDSIDISFLPKIEEISKVNLNQLPPLFMYTQIFKEIILEMKHDEKSFKDFILLWRKYSIDNPVTLKIIAEFERDYCPKTCIKWYTRESFVYQMLNRALRKLKPDIIINMGFFIRDLHQQLEELHQNQVRTYYKEPFCLYRGQGLLTTDFEKLLKSKGGLMSFNNFLSTSKNPAVSRMYAENVAGNKDMVGVDFKMYIDPSISSTPFASIENISTFPEEEEILFSMHTVFRIGEITKIGNNSSFYQVDLKFTEDDDQELRILTDCIRKEVVGETGWQRLGQLLIKVNDFNKAEELYTELLEQTSDEGDKAYYYHCLGCVKHKQSNYDKAIECYKKALEIKEKTLSPNDPSLANSYNNIGEVYRQMGEYPKAISFYEKALEIKEKTLSPNDRSLANSYNNIGLVYRQMGQYSKAVSFYEKDLEISQKTLPPNHPDLTTSYNNIAGLYYHMGKYSNALSFYKKVLEIDKTTLLPNDPDLGTSYNNIGEVYRQMEDYSKAISSYEQALQIWEKTLPPNHRDFSFVYNNMGLIYESMKDYSKALSYFQRAQNIWQNLLLSNHPYAQATRQGIERVKKKL